MRYALLIVWGFLGGWVLLLAFTSLGHTARLALPPLVLNPGESVAISGNGCRPEASRNDGIVTVRCRITVTPTPTPTPQGQAPFSLEIRLDPGDTSTFNAWNAHALPKDAVHTQASNVNEMDLGMVQTRLVSFGDVTNADANIAIAKAHGDGINFNDEGPPCDILAYDEATVYAKARAANVRMTFAPTGVMLRHCPASSFVANTDEIMFQVEAIQDDPNVNFPKVVHDEIALLHAQRPELPIAVQVSVNPPHNRMATAAQVLNDITSLEDGSVDAPIRIAIFYYSVARDPSRAPVMLQVVGALRP